MTPNGERGRSEHGWTGDRGRLAAAAVLYIACIGFLASVIDDLYQRYSAEGRRRSKLEQVQLDQKSIYGS